jgi:hypothetical protein
MARVRPCKAEIFELRNPKVFCGQRLQVALPRQIGTCRQTNAIESKMVLPDESMVEVDRTKGDEVVGDE